MRDHLFISYSSADGRDFALRLADELLAGPPVIPVWLDKRALRPGEDWDDQLVDAIRNCRGLLFVMSTDSVRPESVCKAEWVRALKYKKPVIPLLLHPDAELPFRLGSREYINFTGAFDPAVARLRKHLAWLDSTEGQLQNLKHRLADARRELPRAEPDQQARIKDDIAELERQIAEQQRIIDDPAAAEQRVERSIRAGLEGERRPAAPVGGITRTRFINPPPLIAPLWFQNRHVETQQIARFLKDESMRLLTVVGRGGVGKTAMVCRLLRSLESGILPDDGGPLEVDGIVYLSAAREFHRPNLPDLYAGLAALLPEDQAAKLDALYRSPKTTTHAMVEALAQAFPRGRTVVLLDNFEDMLSVETGRLRDAELDEALRAFLEVPPHGIRIIITTRVAPAELALVQPALQRRLDLDAGLEHPYAENILREMDADGKVGLRNAPAALLSRARERTLGYPRALEHLFGILSADRDTSLQEILDHTRGFLPDRVVAVLVGEAFSRLDTTAQRVMQALAVYRYPVPAAAVDYLLQPWVPGIDSARVLSRLVNMQFVRRDSGRYYVHQVDRDYALSRVTEGAADDRVEELPPLTAFALRHRAAEWFKLTRKPREEWKTLDDLAAQLAEFELRCDGEDFDTAASLLLQFDYDYLLLWGHHRLATELHERLRGKITDPDLAQGSLVNLGTAYWSMDRFLTAVDLYEEVLHLSRESGNQARQIGCLLGLSNCFSDLGENARAMAHLQEALAISRHTGDRDGEARTVANMAELYSELGQTRRALEYDQQARSIYAELGESEGAAINLHNVAERYRDLGMLQEAVEVYTEALTWARRVGSRVLEAGSNISLGEVYVLQENWPAAAQHLQRACEVADDVGSPRYSKKAREDLALVELYRDRLTAARELIEAAGRHDMALRNHRTSVILGLVAMRQADVDTARRAFATAVSEADRLLVLTPERYEALDSKGLALSGLALCGDARQISAASAAFRAARAATSDAGITRWVLFLFDALAHADRQGMLAGVRPEVAGG